MVFPVERQYNCFLDHKGLAKKWPLCGRKAENNITKWWCHCLWLKIATQRFKFIITEKNVHLQRKKIE
jgi:hypothetical protein